MIPDSELDLRNSAESHTTMQDAQPASTQAMATETAADESVDSADEEQLYDTGLPSPQRHPGRDVVIFDGDCRFCLKQVRRLHRWDGGKKLSFISLHSPYVARHYPDLTHQQLMDEMYVVSTDGKRRGGAAAFRYLTRRLPRLWALAPLLHIPASLPVWQWGYRQVAKRRYRISEKMGDGCDNGACDIHFK